MDSHIQMPKFMLRRFENDKHELFYYDVVTKVISRGFSRSINTEEDYYSKGMESFLNRAIETPFSNVVNYIDRIDFDNEPFRLISGFEITVMQFLRALFARNPNNVNEINDNSIFFQFYDPQSKHDATVIAGMEEANEQALFDHYFPTFSVNRSNVPFVLPVCGFYGFKHQNIKHINLPIDPWTAITLIDRNEVDTVFKDGLVHLYLITEDRHSKIFNMLALENQKRQGYGRIISNRREVLEQLVKEN